MPQAARPAPAVTGVDYLGLVAAAHEEETGTGVKVDFSRMALLGDVNGSDGVDEVGG
ncbi:hypothetical protein GHK86_10130 [Acidimicrobiaceae bacterium USS-CC1]|uniref:Uncharacterized protein n=1 Tax=Acidiferrimicrobium australe TaxID=2664430 RepID=A0ABW9QTW0_9ACTN|nr:hypothetical protein [Acidiferrimicrobium australe]